MSMRMADLVRLAIKTRADENTHATLWWFDDVNSKDNKTKTENLFSAFPYDDDLILNIDGRRFKLGIKKADNGGWVVLIPVPTPEPKGSKNVLPKLTLEERQLWWKTHNPHMLDKQKLAEKGKSNGQD